MALQRAPLVVVAVGVLARIVASTHSDIESAAAAGILRVVVPDIGDKEFDVTAFGAAGDGSTDDTAAIQAALDACAAEDDGGVVAFPRDLTFASLPVFVRGDGCALRVEGTLRQIYWGNSTTTKTKDTKNVASADTHFVNVKDVSDFAIYGGGLVDGGGPAWWGGEAARPRLVDVASSDTVALFDATFHNSADHTLEISASNVEIAFCNVTVDWAAFDGNAPNTDGVDLHGSPFYIHDSKIDVGDDNVAIHASDILIENCDFGDDAFEGAVHGHGASIGSLGSGAEIRNVTVRNVRFHNTHVGPNIKVRAGATDGVVEGIVYEDLTMRELQLENLRIAVQYTDALEEADEAASTTPARLLAGQPFVVRDITYRNITATQTKVPGTLLCSAELPCTDLHLVDLDFSADDDDKMEDWQCSDAYGTQDNVAPTACIKDGAPPSTYSYSYSYSSSEDAAEGGGASLGGVPGAVLGSVFKSAAVA